MAHTLVYGVAAIALFAALSFARLRSVWLAVAIAIGPFPGLIAANFVPHAFALRDEILIATFCLYSFELVADGFRLSYILKITICFCGFLFSRFLLDNPESAISIVVTTALAVGSSALSQGLVSRVIGINESRIANINRRRERTERWLEVIVPIVQPRWALAIFGICLVLSAIAFFGAGLALGILVGNKVLVLTMLLIALISSVFAAQDWRMSAAVVLAFCWAALVNVWIITFRGAVLREASLSNYVIMLGLTLASILALCAEHGRFSISKTKTDAAANTIVAQGASFFFAALGAASFLGVLRVGHLVPLSMAMTFIPLIASLFIYLATVSVLETLFPRRISLEERYRLK
jgi:hypothetical protein